MIVARLALTAHLSNSFAIAASSRFGWLLTSVVAFPAILVQPVIYSVGLMASVKLLH